MSRGGGQVELDPRNRGFVWNDHQGPFRRVSPAQAAAFDRDGYFRLEDALDPDTVAGVEVEISPLEQARTRALRAAGGSSGISRADEITFTTHLVTRSRLLRAFAASEPFVSLCADLLGPDVRLYWDQSVYKKPEAPRPFPWHQDTGYRFTEPQGYLTCWIPLVDATVDNGCPWVLPGGHRRGTLRHRDSPLGKVCKDDDDGAVAVEARVGDIIVFSSLTPHRTGPNTTPDVRKAYILQYAVDGTRWPDEDLACDDPERQFPVVAGGGAAGAECR